MMAFQTYRGRGTLMRHGWVAIGLILLGMLQTGMVLAEVKNQPNVLFIAVDDLNDWVGYLGGDAGGHPGAKTPNMDRLAARGVVFSRAYCSAPLCNPSRISLLTGVAPSRSGVYGNGEKLRAKLPDAVTLPAYFRSQGYEVKGGGKIFHGTGPGDEGAWDEFFRPAGVTRAKAKRPQGAAKEMWMNWGPVNVDDDGMFDGHVAKWAVGELGREHDKPLFLAFGLTKPHMPWFAPEKYFAMHPLEGIVLPDVLANDLDDVPSFGRKLADEVYDPSGARNFAVPGTDHANILKYGQWERAVQGYLATISFADAQVGRVLDALESGPLAENTIVVLWGDHGWHLGEKSHWRKHALWEVSTRTALIIAQPNPGVKSGVVCDRVVSLLDLYPTMVELCDLPKREGLDGVSLVGLLDDPNREWDRPAVTTYGYMNHAVVDERYRYIRYHDGTEELYDHQSDPNEWDNLAGDGAVGDGVAGNKQYRSVIKQLGAWLPTVNAAAD